MLKLETTMDAAGEKASPEVFQGMAVQFLRVSDLVLQDVAEALAPLATCLNLPGFTLTLTTHMTGQGSIDEFSGELISQETEDTPRNGFGAYG
ncbi:hypothetical protein [Paracoccus siganidrum]|uniref:hypothetical protein n=1 Tax=Paracoccus siganidrum TaxID=1276757 RepID=UPI0011C374D5|nr:hypothetical protein [Paracoccus siganidrum]